MAFAAGRIETADNAMALAAWPGPQCSFGELGQKDDFVLLQQMLDIHQKDKVATAAIYSPVNEYLEVKYLSQDDKLNVKDFSEHALDGNLSKEEQVWTYKYG